jgi:hypothetical protein
MSNETSINFAHMISNLALDDKDKIVKHKLLNLDLIKIIKYAFKIRN